MKRRTGTAQKLWDRWWWLVPLVVVIAGNIAVWVIVRSGQKPEVQTVATKVKVVTCTDALASDFTCWQSHYKAIVANEGPETAMADFKAMAGENAYVNTNCHQIAHVIGRAAALKYPTLQETYKHGDNYCWSGYYHGAIETVAQKIGPKKILSQINVVCADLKKAQEYSFDHFNCVHGMGHGLMAIQDDELFTALKSCDVFEGSWQQESCYGGVFMENVMDAIHNPATGSAYLKNDDPLYPCNAIETRYEEQCYLMQTSHMLSIEGNDFAKVFGLCATVNTPFDATCYQSLGRDASGQSASSQAITIERCQLGGTVEARRNCYTGAVKDFMSFYHNDDEAYAMCAAIPEPDLAADCRTQGEEYYKIF